jgi:glutamyl-tRNA synthetase
MTVRTRFAPSPTGYLHIGGARTALYSWLYARKHSGVFILRIEDTDRERSTEESVQAILESMKWLGLDYDEGPFYQTQRYERYREVIQQLLDEGKAYRCYCSKERIEALRAEQLAKKQKPRYDGHCRDAKPIKGDQPYVVRFRNPQTGTVEFNDQVHGETVFKNSELDDLVLMRSDGHPTYNFSVVVDDIDMKITHVIRGDDHLNNTPRQINLFLALGAESPTFAHLPMILGNDGQRLSKRHGAVSVMQYEEQGYLPEALLNYLIRLGWSHGDQEIFSQEEMIKLFDLGGINKAAASFNPDKLLWLNQHYLKHTSVEVLAKQLAKQLKQLGIESKKGPELTEVVLAQRERAKTLAEMAEKSRYFYQDIEHYDEKAAAKNLTPEIIPALEAVRDEIESLDDWSDEAIHQMIVEIAEDMELKLGQIAQPLRVALTGDVISPSIDVTLRLIGCKRAVSRLNKAIKYIEARQTVAS